MQDEEEASQGETIEFDEETRTFPPKKRMQGPIPSQTTLPQQETIEQKEQDKEEDVTSIPTKF